MSTMSPTNIKHVGTTLQSLGEVVDSKDNKAILDHYIVHKEATKIRWTGYCIEVDNITRLGLTMCPSLFLHAAQLRCKEDSWLKWE